MTLSVMEFFGIKSDWQKNIIAIKPQKYIGKEYTIENDCPPNILVSNCNII